MGLLSDIGQTYEFFEAVEVRELIKQYGIKQFLEILKKYHSYTVNDMQRNYYKNPNHKQTNKIYWGEEIESNVVVLDEVNQKVRIQPAIYDFVVKNAKKIEEKHDFALLPEFGSWMIQTTPARPYQSLFNFDELISSIRNRSRSLREELPPDHHVLNMPCFPILGTGDFHEKFNERKSSFNIESHHEEQNKKDLGDFKNEATYSQFMDDRLINQHPRFPSLALNIKDRRGEKVEILVPVYRDINTDLVSVSKNEPVPGHIYMDSMHFGMGCCSLQTTFSGQNYDNTRWIYDQMTMLTPLFMALSAGSAIFKGKLADIDTRWSVIQKSVDCRTKEERDPTNKEKYIHKSRYANTSFFISDDARNLSEYNDKPLRLDEKIQEKIKNLAKISTKGYSRTKKQIISCSQRISGESVLQPEEQKDLSPTNNSCCSQKQKEKFMKKLSQAFPQLNNNNITSNSKSENSVKKSSKSDLQIPNTPDSLLSRDSVQGDATDFETEADPLLDDKMIDHLAFLFSRDPLVIFKDQTSQDLSNTNHFENLQSTNWNNVRFKPPPSQTSSIGWRFQFRSMEVQLTDDENIAFSMLSHIFVRLFYSDELFKLNLYIPISLVDQNFRRAQKRNALLTQKFYFRTNIFDSGAPEVHELSIFQIFFGSKENKFCGLTEVLVKFFQISKQVCKEPESRNELNTTEHLQTILQTIEFIRKKCTGEIPTLASYVRAFVMAHPLYQRDSVISEKINFDLCARLIGISNGTIQDQAFPVLFQEEYQNQNQNDQSLFFNPFSEMISLDIPREMIESFA